MPVELIVAPPATGKTSLCLQRIKALQSENPLAQIWAIVPDRLQAAAFRQRLAVSGGVVGVQVGRFPDLYKYILEREGTFQPSDSEPLLHRLIQETVDEAAAAGKILYYQPLQFFPGFINVLRDAFGELERALIFSDIFADLQKSELI